MKEPAHDGPCDVQDARLMGSNITRSTVSYCIWSSTLVSVCFAKLMEEVVSKKGAKAPSCCPYR